MADKNTGTILSLANSDIGPLVAQSNGFSRSPILDMQLDKSSGRLWVLGTTRINVLDARSLDLKESIPLNAYNVGSLHLDTGGVRLHSSNRDLLARIEGKS